MATRSSSRFPSAAEPASQARSLSQWLIRLFEPRLIGPLFAAAVITAAAVLIHRLASGVHLGDIALALGALSKSSLAWSLGLSALSFWAMALNEDLATRNVGHGRIASGLAFLSGFAGLAISNAIGLHPVMGGSVRYHIYTQAGLDASDVGRIAGFSAMSFGLGLTILAGAALAIGPADVPVLGSVPPSAGQAAGVALLFLLVGFLAWLGRGRRSVVVLGWTLRMPKARVALLQTGLGAANIAAAAGALWVLLPSEPAPDFATFLIIFIIAILLGMASQAPGGLGVLDATILIGLGDARPADSIASLLAFRVTYYLIPFVVALLALARVETARARDHVPHGLPRSGLGSVGMIVAPASAALVFLGGCVLLVSTNTPSIGTRLEALSRILPLPFAEASHLLSSLVGLALIVIARGLFRRTAKARWTAMALLLAGALFSLAKGLDWEEAVILTTIAAGLALSGPAFHRKGDWQVVRPDPLWIGITIIAIAGLTLFGFFAYRHVEYQNQLWWRFAWDADAPRFLRAMLVVGVVAAALALDALVNRPGLRPREGPLPIPSVVRDLLDQCPATQPQIALLGDKRFMAADDHRAFLMYAVSGRRWISMGDPVGEAEAGEELIWRLAEAADRAGARAIYYAVGMDYMPVYVDLGLSMLKIGEAARVCLSTFTLQGAARQSLRYALERSRREGLRFEVLPREGVPYAMPQLREISDAWLAQKRGREKGFSLGRFDESYLCEFDCAVLTRGNEMVAFANLWRGADRHELSIDLMRYKSGVSKTLMEAFITNLLLYGGGEGYRWFNLGAAPLAGLSVHPLASTWNRLGTFIYRNGDEFYNFEGLRAFKQKFDPVWSPQYLACPSGLGSAHSLFAVASLISGGSLGLIVR